MMRRFGIFGGTFNPIHNGHLIMAEAARKEYKLDVIYFIPCGVPPHKQKDKLFPTKFRYEIVRKSIKGKKYFKILGIEIKKRKPSYTYETVRELRTSEEKRPGEHSVPYFLIGQDEFENLHTWYKANALSKLVIFLVLPRPNKKIKVPEVKNLTWHMVHTKPVNISSSEVRERIKKKKSISNLVPRNVEKILQQVV